MACAQVQRCAVSTVDAYLSLYRPQTIKPVMDLRISPLVPICVVCSIVLFFVWVAVLPVAARCVR